MTGQKPSMLLLTAALLMITRSTNSAQQQQLELIVEANATVTLVTYNTYPLGKTVSSPQVYVPPSAYIFTESTLVSSGYLIYLSESRLQIFNDTAETLQLLYSYILSSNCTRPRLTLTLGLGVLSSDLVNPVQAIALAECDGQVYGLFPDSNCGFRLQKLLDASTALPLHDNTTVGMVTRSDPDSWRMNHDGDLSGRSYLKPNIIPEVKYGISSNCLDSAPLLLLYDKDEFILRCSNGPSYFCTTDVCESKAISNLAGVNEVQVAFGKDIAAVLNSDSISIYSNRFMSLVCSIPITTEHQLYDLTVTQEAAIHVLK